MKTYNVFGTEFKKNDDTWEYEPLKQHQDLIIDLDDFDTTENDLDFVGHLIAKKFGFDSFELLGYQPI